MSLDTPDQLNAIHDQHRAVNLNTASVPCLKNKAVNPINTL